MSEKKVLENFLRPLFVSLKRGMSREDFDALVRELTADEPVCAECMAEKEGEAHRDAQEDAPASTAYQE